MSGYEGSVGSRTDLLVANAHMRPDLPAAARLAPRAVLCLLTPRDARLDLGPFARWAEGLPVLFSFVPDGVAPKVCPRSRPLTTGTYALQLLLWQLPVERIFLTGFTFFHGIGAEGHYWDPRPTPALTFHDPDQEARAAAAVLSAFSGSIETTPDVAARLAPLGVRLGGSTAHSISSNRPLGPRAGGRLGWALIEAGLRLRRWAELGA